MDVGVRERDRETERQRKRERGLESDCLHVPYVNFHYPIALQCW